MSERYPGGFITKTPTAPTSSSAPGIWTLDQAMQNQKAGNWPAPPSPYIEDWFSTYLYTGNDAALTVTNGINLSTYGGLVWGKSRSASQNHRLYDTARGSNYSLISNDTAAQSNQGANACAFNTNGFSLSAASGIVGSAGFGGPDYVSWTFAKRQKFFDVVTYTGDGTTAGRNIAHSLGSVPGFYIVKPTSTTGNWLCRPVAWAGVSDPDTYLVLNSTAAATTWGGLWGTTNFTPTSTTFSIGGGGSAVTCNASGVTYVAYLFASNAGGFGLSGSDNVISCGSFTTDAGGNATVTLGYEPQWVLLKDATNVANWGIVDVMRNGLVNQSATSSKALFPNLANAESNLAVIGATSTGFSSLGAGTLDTSSTYIYIAIRRGPMKVPTTGTSVLNAITRSGNSTATTVTGVGFAPDLVFEAARTNSGGNNWIWFDRLRGGAEFLSSDNTGAAGTNSIVIQSDSLSTTMDGFRIQTANPINASGNTYVYYPLKRAPGFFDEVCYTGTGSNPNAVSHNLTVTPELIITKRRSTTSNWFTFYNITGSNFQRAFVDLTNAGATWTYSDGAGLGAAPTSTTFTLDTASGVNASASTYVAYLFATCPGVSKVGSYTGTAALLTVNCGFTSGARFVLIKRTDSTGDWYVYDSARGISSGTDPYLLINSTAAETTGTNYVDTDTTGFKVTAAAPVGLNASGGTYIFLAIA